ncbi:ABC transporter permease [Dyadobacter psychrotolerans]|uniref:ABC transporter permease n=1 Tax=Dyadobacter psychrotolerans TaxID=2541721 RepID=A0A4R5DRR1_9BACT|nr:FtsX-like permease family protein [Dyadobacter psychrotolerans]TDE17112.1 ABC transporter permease [Dyadobacter psychrotolerans]
MFVNNIKIAFRNLQKHKVYSLINIVGLGIGLAASFIVLQVVIHELSYDRFHKKGDRIFAIQHHNPSQDLEFPNTNYKDELAPYLKEIDPAIVNYVRISNWNSAFVQNPSQPDRLDTDQQIAFADTSFFNVFTFKLVKGNAATALKKPLTVVITEKMAEKYFGNQDPVGRKLLHRGPELFSFTDKKTTDAPFTKAKTTLLEVTGVMENTAANSTLEFEIIGSTDTGKKLDTLITAPYYETFLMLDSENSARSVLKKIPAACKFIDGYDYNSKNKYRLQPLFTMHANGPASENMMVKAFFGIALGILLLALFNYINLTTARAVVRAKEVGVRKTLGVSRFSLLGQFFTESMLITLLAFLLAVVLTFAFRPFFNDLLGFDIKISELKRIPFVSAAILVLVLTALLAGIYPSIILSGFSPAKVLRGNVLFNSKGLFARRVFIILQFGISTSLILGSVVAEKQISFMKNKNPGYNKEQLVNIDLGKKLSWKSWTLKQELKNRHGFENVSTSVYPLLGSFVGINHYNPVKREQAFIWSNTVDEDFIENMEVKVLIPIDKNIPPVDGYYYVITETTVKALGLTNDNAVGSDLFSEAKKPMGKVAGVIRDIDNLGPKVKMGAFILKVHDERKYRQPFQSLQVRLNPKDNIQQKIALLEKVYKQFEPERTFQYSFADDDFNEMFKEDLRVSKMLNVFMAIAVFIACLGLFGLVTFMTQIRMKEIGIRKVLGANVFSIVAMFSFEFVKLVIIAIVIGLGLSYLAVNEWLKNFAFQAEINWMIYILAGLISVFLAFITVGLQSMKAALQNPVNSLKIE